MYMYKYGFEILYVYKYESVLQPSSHSVALN